MDVAFLPPSWEGPWCWVALLKLFPELQLPRGSGLICAFVTCILLCVLFFVYLFRGWGGVFCLNIIFLPCAVAKNLKQQGKMVTGRARKGRKMFLVLKAKSITQCECVKQSGHRFLGLKPEWRVIFVISSISHIFFTCVTSGPSFLHVQSCSEFTSLWERNWGSTKDLVTLLL